MCAVALTSGALAGCGRSEDHAARRASPIPKAATVRVTITRQPVGRPIPPGFLGLSFEYQGTRHYTGVNARAVNPVLVQLIRNLSQAPVLRIGGDSTDASWWPIPGIARPPWVKYTLTPSWIQTTGALARELGARLIVGINLTANSRAIAGGEARALVTGIGRRYIAALEIGNEPEVYGQIPWYAHNGRRVYARSRSYGSEALRSYARDVAALRQALPPLPLAGPATGGQRQLVRLPELLAALPQLRVVTFHRYPSSRCYPSADSPVPDTIAGLLSAQASRGLMRGSTRYVELAHRHRASFRIDELNTVACEGKRGVTDTFASALWAVDTLFALARDGVDGVNIHTFPGSAYSLFLVTHPSGRWQAFVHPEYYGLLLFARAAPPGSRLLGIRVDHAEDVRAWATRAADGTVRVVLINDGTDAARRVFVRLRAKPAGATLERLQARDVSSTAGVTLAGQSFGPATRTGALGGAVRKAPLAPVAGGYRLVLPAGSAALITVRGP
jgi:hypothetical protein